MQCMQAFKPCIHCTQVLETSFDLLFLEQITQLLCIGVPETFAVYAGLKDTPAGGLRYYYSVATGLVRLWPEHSVFQDGAVKTNMYIVPALQPHLQVQHPKVGSSVSKLNSLLHI